MRSFKDGSSSSRRPNAFQSSFLRRLGQRDEPFTAWEADTAGPWRVEEVPGEGFGVFRAGESLQRGFPPVAAFPSRELALVAAAVLPGTGREPLLRLQKDADDDGVYPVLLESGEQAGRSLLFDEKLVDAMNVLLRLFQEPRSLAQALSAAGAVSLERCGTILDEEAPALDPEP